jgi:hypothetical protein
LGVRLKESVGEREQHSAAVAVAVAVVVVAGKKVVLEQ